MSASEPPDSGTAVSHAPPLPATVQGRNLVSLARPYFGLIVLTMLLLAALGAYSAVHMPSGIYPEVAFSQIVVIVGSPGLNVQDIENGVTRPIEERVISVLGANRVRSTTKRGSAELRVDFTPGTDMIQALNDVRAKMAEVQATLPLGTTTIVERQTPSIFPIISFVVTGGESPAKLYEYAFRDLRLRIGSIEDVARIEVQGGDVEEVSIAVDPRRLVETGLSITEVADRIDKDHQLKAVGRLDRGPVQFEILTNTQAVSADSHMVDLHELENRVIAVKNNQPIRLRDIGEVSLSHVDRTQAIRSGGKDAVALTVFRRLGGNALAISHALDAALVDAQSSAPQGIKITPVYDQGELVKTAIENVRDAMIIGGVFSVLILLLFLKSIRATLIAATAIPLSLLISFVFLRLTGDTLNLMSLGGLAVAVGLIIDDAVVVVENIARHLSEGQSGDVAVDSASKEISGAVIGSTLTTILVFVPLAFVKGVTGQFFQSLSMSLSIALLASMVVSLTLIPVLASRFLTRKHMPSTGPIYNYLARSYEYLLRGGLYVPRLTLLLALACVIPGIWLWNNVKSDYMPEMDESACVFDYSMPVGTSLAQTDAVLRRVEGVLVKSPYVTGYIRRTGAELGLFATESFTGDILISLKPAGQRPKMQELFKLLNAEIANAAPELVDSELIPLVHDQMNDLGGFERSIEVKIFGPDPEELRKLAKIVAREVRREDKKDPTKNFKLRAVNAHDQVKNPDLVIKPDGIEMARLGITAEDIAKQVSVYLYGQIVSTVPERDRITNIRVRLPDDIRFDPEQLEQLPISLPVATSVVPVSTGASTPPAFVPLGQLASIELVRSPNERWRENQQPVINVTAEPIEDEKDFAGVNRKLRERMEGLQANNVFPTGYRWELGGSYKAQQESFVSLFMVLIVATALVFLLLGFQFHSLALPLLIFLTQPISLTCALFALWLTHTPLNVSSFMGGILLIGLDVKNGIILIEYIGQLVNQGVPLADALVRAGRTRFRPILMTSLMSIFGLVPLAMGFGPGAQMQQPLAIAVIGGLIANMLVTRLLVPVGYRVLRGRAATAVATA